MSQTVATSFDDRHLERAIELAQAARGHTSPNPLVGCVVVKQGRTIGEGFHEAAGQPHAERAALAACTEDPNGATLFVSLEPCAHEGRTPPCTEAILAAGVARVVVASDDPTGKASGRGLGILRDEGVQVDVVEGDLGRRARLINQPFRKHARTGRPLVIAKLAMTLDGRVATSSGDSQWISGEFSRARAHRWRAECDAVAVGIGTALADDPRLTARIEGVAAQPRRVVFDSSARLPTDGELVRGIGEAELILVCSRGAPRSAVEALRAAGAHVIVVSGGTEGARVAAALDELGRLEIQSLLLEGGPHLIGAFLDAGEIDELRAFIAPIVLGGREARAAIDGGGAGSIADALRVQDIEVERIGEDVLISGRLREW